MAGVTAAAAEAFLDRVEADETFANELVDLRGDPASALARVREAGFDVTPDELRDAVLERYGGMLTVEQLDKIAADVSQQEGELIAGATVGTVVGVTMLAVGAALVI
jgi:hypothetical protein